MQHTDLILIAGWGTFLQLVKCALVSPDSALSHPHRDDGAELTHECEMQGSMLVSPLQQHPLQCWCSHGGRRY